MNDLSAALRDQAQALMKRYGVPGVAVGIWNNGEESLAGFGVTSVEHPLPVDADTLFQIGSTSKTATATLAMILAEEGRLDLDQPIRRYWPEFRLQDAAATQEATLRHCFTHTGGWLGDYFDDTGDGADALARYVERMAKLPQLTPVGQVWSYNNAGFSLAGRVIELAAGCPFEQLMVERLLAPLNMDHSFYFAKEVITHGFAVGHNVDPERGAQVARPWALSRSAHPAGGIISSVRDQMRYARFHLGDGTAPNGRRILSEQGLRVMQQPHAEAGSMADAVGISWLLASFGGERTVAHGGATNGQLSAFVLAPARNFAVTVLTNANRGRELHRDLVNWVLEKHLGLVQPEPVLLQPSAAALAEYAGRYEARLSHLEVTPVKQGLRIQTHPQGGFPLPDSPPGPTLPPSTAAFVEQGRLLFIDGPAHGGRAEVLRDPEGRITWLRVGGRIHKRVA